MDTAEVTRAIGAAVSTATALGLRVEDAAVLQASNRLAVRLMPCDVLARVAPGGHQAGAAFEVEAARRLVAVNAPVAGLDPRVEAAVHVRDGYAITLWTYYPSAPGDMESRAYAEVLERLHASMRQADLAAPHFTDRVLEAQALVDDRLFTPDLTDADRSLLSSTLRSLTRMVQDRGAPEQLLHGEPHAGNLLRTQQGLLFIDLETCCYGPIEFDIAHCSGLPAGVGNGASADRHYHSRVSEQYRRADQELVRVCWVLMLAIVAAWRWDYRDQFPDGRRMGTQLLNEIRIAIDQHGLRLDR